MEWWILELITVAVMVGVVGVLGPLIKRFGKAYAAHVFRANPRTGKSYLVLLDSAYFVIGDTTAFDRFSTGTIVTVDPDTATVTEGTPSI